MDSPPPRPARKETVFRIGLAALGIVLAVVAVGRFWALSGEQEALTDRLAAAGPVDARLERELAREADVDGLRVRAARASLVREMSLVGAADASTPEGRAELRQSASRLDETARLAAGALARRPASWEAAMVLGAATYLSRSAARDSRLFTAHEEWEEPLAAALRLAPTKREPVRFLTAAYLEIWPALSPPKRAAALPLVTEMLRSPADADLILGPWLDAAGDRQDALAALPSDPGVWDKVQQHLAARSDWEGFSLARGRWNHILHARLRSDLAAADASLADGDVPAARALYLSVLEQVRPDLSSTGLMVAALSRCPPGPVGHETAQRFARLLDWALERCLLGRCALPSDALKRLARFSGDAAPSQEATALLLAGDLPGARALERHAEPGWSDAWAPYLLVKTREMIRRERLDEATAALDFVPRSWWESPTYWQTRLEWARATAAAAAAEQAADRLRAMTRTSWPAAAWSWQQGHARLKILTAAPATGLELAFADVAPGGAGVELRMDGALLGAFPARPGGSLALDAPLGPGLHVLEVEGFGNVIPGAVRLR
jgi:hypothetical protein